MSVIHSHINKKFGIIFKKVIGSWDSEAVKAEIETTVNHPDFKREYSAIYDIRSAEISSRYYDDVQYFATWVEGQVPARGEGYKVAIVASDAVQYGLARMYMAIGDQLPFEIMVFRDIRAAFEWVKKKDLK